MHKSQLVFRKKINDASSKERLENFFFYFLLQPGAEVQLRVQSSEHSISVQSSNIFTEPLAFQKRDTHFCLNSRRDRICYSVHKAPQQKM